MNRTEQSYDVVIVGAGICGLNALFVAAQYLPKGGRIALVERRSGEGGMWNDAYDYVRLHQGHPVFTVGDLRWQWDKDPTHLSTKPEILDHLSYCFRTIKQRAEIGEYFGWSYVSHVESGDRVLTTIERDGETRVLESARMVKALGLNVEVNQPLELTSTKVRSVSPDFCDVRTGEIAASTAPVWVIGGGKTGMDTVGALLDANPAREVDLLAGSGTWFVRRDEMYHPRPGMRRGTRANRWGEDFAMSYDGTNEATVYDNYMYTKVTPEASNFVVGLLSDAEAARIKAGVTRMVNDHLVDVVDTSEGAELVLRSGSRVSVPQGTWVVNCTGYLLKPSDAGRMPYEPFVSPSGQVLSINPHSDTLIFSTYAGYLLTHALMRGKLATLPLAEIDFLDLRSRYGSGTTPAAWTVLLYNFAVLAFALPPKVFLQMGVDADHWYPFVRRQFGMLQFLATRHRQMSHYRKTMATVRERYDVRCGPLASDRIKRS